ncbi:MipA/OmpV family protein [Piscirickettsia litoralis]|uniref:Structural protein MipA n=1 Tax=Piscirickettsia litoralis TaxID=1891921 RepID=A0ABX3A1W6_9GAMM|nr:MipA/OmpV family protein [Piscirickettsia litoralis]ODN42852.1 hypothetical protein BGC07_07855 [Piscirickettsia litoralis]
MKKAILVAVVGCLGMTSSVWALKAAPGGAGAQQPQLPAANMWHYSTSIGAGWIPQYSGSKSYKATPLVNASAKYNDYRIALNGSSALTGINIAANVIPSKKFHFGPIFVYSFGRDDDTGNAQVNKLTEVDKSLFGGAFASYNFYKLMNPYDKLTLRTDVLHDVGGHSQGYVVNLSANYSTPLSKKLFIVTGVSARYGSSDFMESFYGVSTTDAANSGISAYKAGASLQSASVHVTGNYLINKAWSTFVSTGYTRLLGDAKDSSIVKEVGTANQFFVGAGVSYRF